MLRRIGTLVALLVLFATTSVLARPLAKGTSIKVEAATLRPSQMDIGPAEVEATLATWREQAKDKGVKWKRYVEKTLTKRFDKLELPAVIDPAGRVMPLDGHHRITALLRVAKETGIAVPVRVTIIKDYSGWTKQAFADDFIGERGLGYFSRRVARLAPVQRIDHLPETFDDLHANALRSMLGESFRRLRLDDYDLVDYAQFKVGDWLLDHGLLPELSKAGLVARGTRTFPEALIGDDKAEAIVEGLLTSKEGRAFSSSLAVRRKEAREIEERLRHAAE